MSVIDYSLSKRLGLLFGLQSGLRLHIWQLLISNDSARLVGLDLPDLVVVGAWPQRRHRLHAGDRGDGNGRLRLAEGGEGLGWSHGELLLSCHGQKKAQSDDISHYSI